MTTEKEMLRRKTERHYMLVVFLNGVKNIRYDRRKRTIFLSAALAVLLLTAWLCQPGRYMLPILWQVAVIGYSAAALAVLAAVTYWLGRVPHARQYYEDFLRIGWANSAGEPPVLTEYREVRDKLVELHFYSKGLPRAEWEENKARLETALNLYILEIREGASRREVVLLCAPGDVSLPTKILWKQEYLSAKDFELVLGEDPAGQVTIDLAKIPHLICAGCTGMGKSQMLLLMIVQSLEKGADVFLADLAKQGTDYAAVRDKVRLLLDYPDLLAALDEISAEMDTRRDLFLASGCSNIVEYNMQGHDMRRIILFIDETAALLNGSSKERKALASQTLEKLIDLARLGRFAGISLVFGNQRTSVQNLPGDIKTLCDLRLSAKLPDTASSMCVLDDGSAATLPAIAGRFLLRDGTGIDKIFQAYYYADRD